MVMKATGIVRRIDDLGRVVIPKEIRRTMRIREGDPLEIYTDHEGEVIFKKYSPIGEMHEFAWQFAETLHKTCDLMVVITDRDAVIACSGVPKKEYSEKRLSADLEKITENRAMYKYRSGERRLCVIDDASGTHYISCCAPIVFDGDIIGSVVSVLPENVSGEGRNTELEAKMVQTAAAFLAKLLS
ncbi:MAG: AbrB/MazE/SpoVT family DNA-binding domain-containing protein [Oscillospiraceae bacterium]|nr:AbrB/MazE/SpoVT family DNA-binding domain-containing protein [Oscillospiraceae bacterium]